MREQVSLQVGSKKASARKTIQMIEDQLRGWEKYPQGFTFIYESSLNENMDAEHPLEHLLLIPDDVLVVDRVQIWLYSEAYRIYVKSAAAGGGVAQTSEATIPPSITSGPSSKETDDNASGDPVTTSGPSSTATSSTSHTHKFLAPNATHWPVVYQAGLTYLVDDSGALSATVSTGETVLHTHDIQHTHSVPGSTHNHGMDHTHNIPGSEHFHQVGPFPSHQHDLVFGIEDKAWAGAAITFKIVDPDNVQYDLGVVGSGLFSIEGRDYSNYFQKPGTYKLQFSTGYGVAHIRSMIYVQAFIQPE